ncbi:MAG: type III-B CRISPR module RAMP protein Cmr6 [Bacillota bacterium]
MYYHPKDTQDIFEKKISNLNESVDNLWYRVHYFQQNSLHDKSQNRLVKLPKNLRLNRPTQSFLNQRLQQRAQLLSHLQASCELAGLKGFLQGRLIHGLGGAHVRETSLTLHPLYGLPYIPGSSLKGAVRNWVLQAFFQGDEDSLKKETHLDQTKAEIRTIFFDLFGSEEQAGLVEFFDAFVESDFSLQPDILTVHFPKYYSGEKSPTDDQNPNPVDFYTINCSYLQFFLAVKKGRSTRSSLNSAQLMELAVAWTQKALSELGIGSKTSAGYGYFSKFEQIKVNNLRSITAVNQSSRKNTDNKSADSSVKGPAPAKDKNSPVGQVESQPMDLGPGLILVRLINQLAEKSEQDRNRSKGEVYQQVLALAEQGELEPARSLKAYWERSGDWKKPNKKQQQKIDAIRKILGE